MQGTSSAHGVVPMREHRWRSTMRRARAQAEKHRTVRKHRRSRQGRTRAWRGHRLSSTGHPGSEREVEGVEARFLVRAQAEKHRAVRKSTHSVGE